MKKCMLILFALLLHGSTSAWAVNQIKFATVAPEGTSMLVEIHRFAREIQEKTGGEVEIKIYDSAKMGDEADVLRKMRSGQLHAGGFTGHGLGQVASAIRIMEMPYLFRTREELDYVFEKMYPTFARLFEAKGFMLMSIGDAGEVYIFSKTPVRTREDLRATKMWVWEGDPLASSFFKAGGISPVPLAITDVVTSLQTGMINGFYIPPSAAIGLQWADRVQHMTRPKLNNVAGGILFTQSKWKTLSPKAQQIVGEAAKNLGHNLTQVARSDNQEAFGKLREKQIQFVDMESASETEYREISAQVQRELTGKLYDQSVLSQVEKYLADYRAKPKSS